MVPDVPSSGVPDGADFLRSTYEQRFSAAERADKDVLWGVLAERVFQQYVPTDGAVLDLGAGYCELINAIVAQRRIAIDLNPDTEFAAAPDVEVILTRSDDLSMVDDGSIDTVLSSNFFEHLADKQTLLATLAEARRVLRPDGRIAVLMPNLRYLPGAYWDYLDHHIPLTHVSLCEALTISGFDPTRVVPRFLPYTVRDSRLPAKSWLIRSYLAFPPAWRILGRQMLVVADVRH